MRGHISTIAWHLALAILALRSHSVDAAEIRRKDGIHRVGKLDAVITQAPHLDRRAQTACPASHSLCAPDLSGGCCENGYSCAVDSCYATTQGPVTCDNRVGYYACGIEYGGGCCPVGSMCERGSKCIPVSGVSYSHECGANSFLCPESLGYGCCGDGLACGQNRCFSTEPSTFVFTRTVTSTGEDGPETATTTVTTVSTPSAESDSTETPDDLALYKFYPTSIEKADPIVDDSDSDDDSGGGLTSAQIGGAVAGAIIFLIIIVVAAFFIIRHLNHVAKVIEKAEPDGDDRRETHDYSKSGDADIDSINTSAAGTASPRSRFRSGTTDSESERPSLFGLPSPGSTSGGSSRRQSYRSSLSSARRTPSSIARSPSTRSATGGTPTPDGFATPITPGEEPAELEGKNILAELDSESTQRSAELDTGSSASAAGAVRATRSKDAAPHAHKRSLSAAPQLDVVKEDGEDIHGYHGPSDKVVGQTGARTPNET